MKQSHKTLILWLLIILVFIAFYKFFQVPGQETRKSHLRRHGGGGQEGRQGHHDQGRRLRGPLQGQR